MTEPTQPLTEEALESIRDRDAAEFVTDPETVSGLMGHEVMRARVDRRALLAEANRLRAELDSMTKFAEDLREERDRRLRSEGELGVELDRLRAENTAQAAKLDQFRSFPDNPGHGNWSASYRMGYAEAGRDVRAIVRALDQSGEGQANG